MQKYPTARLLHCICHKMMLSFKRDLCMTAAIAELALLRHGSRSLSFRLREGLSTISPESRRQKSHATFVEPFVS